MERGGEGRVRGKKRVRTKGVQKRLLEQIEFYFSDANLQKDRFLQRKMREHPDGYVPVATIASFNKMKSLTTDIKMVVKSMKSSSLLKVTEDEKWVKRSIPLPTATDTDERTIYVECLPPNYDQESVRKLLKVFGNITYVSVPRHKISGAIKGFAFVEFSRVVEATAALEYFKSGTKPSTSTKTQSDVSSQGVDLVQCEGHGSRGEEERCGGGREGKEDIGNVQQLKANEDKKEEESITETMVEGGEKNLDGDGVGCGEKAAVEEGGRDNDGEEDSLLRKRKRDEEGDGVATEGDTSESTPSTKRTKCQQPSDGSTKDTHPLSEVTKSVVESSKVHKASDATTSPDPAVEQKGSRTEVEEETESRKRKRDDHPGEEKEEEEEESLPCNKNIRVDTESPAPTHTPDNSGGSKGRVTLERLDSQTTTDTGGEEEGGRHDGRKGGKKRNRQHKKKDWEISIKNLQLRVMSKKEWLEMREIFRGLQKEKVKEMKQQLKEEGDSGSVRKEGKAYVANCLVKVEGVGLGEGEDMITVDKIKNICRKHGVVAYVDIKDDESEGYVRFSNSGCVENLVNSESQEHVKFSAVSDEDERAYYLKSVAARKQMARNKKGKKRNIRGQDKIISRALQHQTRASITAAKSSQPTPAATHIRFSDSDHES